MQFERSAAGFVLHEIGGGEIREGSDYSEGLELERVHYSIPDNAKHVQTKSNRKIFS